MTQQVIVSLRGIALLLCLAGGPLALAQPGTISTYAGAFPDGFGGPAEQAVLIGPGTMTADQSGNIYIGGFTRIYRLSPDGRLTSFAGNGSRMYNPANDVPAASASVYSPSVAIDSKGNIAFAEFWNHRVRRISTDGTIRTIAGTGTLGFAGDGGPATTAQVTYPQGLAFDSSDNLYLADGGNNRVRRIATDGTISTVAGNGTAAGGGDGGPALSASLNGPQGVAFDSSGNLLIADTNNRRLRRVAPNGTITTIAAQGLAGIPTRDTHNNVLAWTGLFDVAVDAAGNVYYTITNHVMKLDRAGVTTVFAGSGANTALDNYRGPAVDAAVVPTGLLASRGSVYVSLAPGQNVARIDSTGTLSTVAGISPTAGSTGPIAYARLQVPTDVAADANGNLYIMEIGNVRKISPGGAITIYSVTNSGGADGIAVDRNGNIYVADRFLHVIFRTDTAGRTTVFAGRGVTGFGGDGGPALQATFSNIGGLAFDAAGSLYVGDRSNHRVRKITPDGIINTFAGTGTAGALGDGGPATSARLNAPGAVAFDPAGNLYIADILNNKIRKVTPQGIISTYAGNGSFMGGGPTGGDGGLATQARVAFPGRVACDAAGNVYIPDSNRIRKVTPNGIITTVAGNGVAGLSGDGGPAVNASLSTPQGLAFDANGNLYIADSDNNRVRRVQGSAPFSAAPASLLFSYGLGGAASSQSVSISSADGAIRTFGVRSSALWLTAAPASGNVTVNESVSIAVTANPAGLAKGTYIGKLTLEDAASAFSLEIPVTMTISGTAAQLRLSKVGLTFTTVQGGSAPPSQTLQALNTGTGTMAWSAAATTIAGGAWLSVAPSSGSTTAGGAAPPLTVSVNPAGLAAGSYYGQVNITSNAADNSPQSAVVLLNILPSDGTPGAIIDPAGLLFTAAPGANPAVQSIEIANSSNRGISYTAAVRFTNGTGWLTAPTAGVLLAGQRQRFDIQARGQSLAAGVYRATIIFTIAPDNVTRNVEVALVLNTGIAPQSSKLPAAAGCAPRQLVSVIRRPGSGYQTAAGWPIPVEAAVVDDCGDPLEKGRVTATFSSNDPQLQLIHTGSGTWQSTWASRSTQANLTITLAAQGADQSLAGQTQVAIRSDLNPDQPSIAPGGVLNAASFRGETPLAPGAYVSVFGARLAQQFEAASTLPLPPSLGETTVVIAGKVAPLHFASGAQVNAILPYDIADSTTHQMIVRRGTLLSLPEALVIGNAQPAVFTVDGSGNGLGHIYGTTPVGVLVLADNARPVKPSEIVVIYATGLGPVDIPVIDGGAAPSGPFALTKNRITVTIQGKNAPVIFAGLAPGFAGVYQINAQIPADVTPDAGAPLIVMAGEQSSPPVTVAVTRIP